MILQSSSDPKKLSMTVEGALIGIVPVMIAIFKLLEIDIAESEIMELIQLIGVAVSLSVAAVGAVRKVLNRAKPLLDKLPKRSSKKKKKK